MKAIIPLTRGHIEVEGEDTSELFKARAQVLEVFGETQCGLCGSKNIIPVVRKNKDEEEFYEYQCIGMLPNSNERCRAYLALGQNKKGGGLFPIRKLDSKGKPDRAEGTFGSHRGWTRYRGEPKQ